MFSFDGWKKDLEYILEKEARYSSNIEKARLWECILYTSSMVENWKEIIDDVIQRPFAYCLHDKDVKKDGSPRDPHVHLIIAFDNPTTKNHVKNLANGLTAKGKDCCCPCAIAVVNAKSSYNYLIHDTKKAREQGKHLYDPLERVTGNLFDIGMYEQLSQYEKDHMVDDMVHLILENRISNFADFHVAVYEVFDFEYVKLIKSYSGYFDRIIRGVYNKYFVTSEPKPEKNHETESESENVDDSDMNCEKFEDDELDPDEGQDDQEKVCENYVADSNIEETERIFNKNDEGSKKVNAKRKIDTKEKFYRHWTICFDEKEKIPAEYKESFVCLMKNDKGVYKGTVDFGFKCDIEHVFEFCKSIGLHWLSVKPEVIK